MTLRRKSPIGGWASVWLRVGTVVGVLGFVILVHWLERHNLKDIHDGHVGFVDVVYFTMISITTTGYGDIVPISNSTRLFDALVVTPIRIFFVLLFIGTAYTFVLKQTWSNWLMARLQRQLCDHIVIAGFGTSGSEAVDELIARGIDPATIVVIDAHSEALQRAESLGCPVLQADATRDRTLQAVKIDRARALIISAGRDDTSILICLTARHLAPELRITIAVRAEDNELPARAAGATTVINPVSFAGLLLAGSAHGPNISDYLSDLASAHGRVRLAERDVLPEECGRSLAELATGLGVRVYREGRPIGFWEEAARSLCTGDRIVEIVPSTESEADMPLPSGPARATRRS
jgi:voltage-gated potassium channel